MSPVNLRRLALIGAAGAAAAPAPLLAQQLGGGSSPEVSIVRIVGALIICLLLAFLAIIYLKHRSGGPIAFKLGRLVSATSEIEVRETRRLTVQHHLSLVRCSGREFLLLLSPGDSLLLSERELPAADDEVEVR